MSGVVLPAIDPSLDRQLHFLLWGLWSIRVPLKTANAQLMSAGAVREADGRVGLPILLSHGWF
jgi:hypothetical protein